VGPNGMELDEKHEMWRIKSSPERWSVNEIGEVYPIT
jgi:hypothetical protein